MNKRITSSPLERARAGKIGSPAPETEADEQEPQPLKRVNSKALKSETPKEEKRTEGAEALKKLSVYMTPSRHQQFKLYAVRHNDDMNAIINRLIERLLEEEA